MICFPEMGTTTLVASGDHVRAIGWLDASQPFMNGHVEPAVAERIRLFAARWFESARTLRWPAFAGPHLCNLCNAFRASGDFGVPDGKVLYVCPQMIAHYVDVHEYAPPAEFIAAIARAADPDSAAYAQSVARFRR
jgi:hypothetical protein